MTDSYNQSSINIAGNPEALEIQSYDFRQVQAFVPAGTTATIQQVKIPEIKRLSRLSWAGVVAPGAGESVTLRLFRIRPSSSPAGFGFILLNTAFVINAASFTDPGGDIDISSTIIPGRCVLPDEYLACSWVHVVGAGAMQPLNMNWNFAPVGQAEPEPLADALVWPPV